MEITGIVQREAWLNKVLPPVEWVAEGIWSIPVVFPGNPMRYTLAYIVVEGNDCLVVDPGFDSIEGRLGLIAGLRAAGVGILNVTGIVATNFHTDHLGMARWLGRWSGAWVGLGRAEKRYISAFEHLSEETDADGARMRAWGVPEDRVQETALDADRRMHLKRLADADLRLGDGDSVPISGGNLTVVETPGHTPGHICLRDGSRKIFLSGDHILPRISPNISLEMRSDPDPLRSWLRSLERIEEDDEFEVLPAHEYRFRGLTGRARQLKALALDRSQEVIEHLSLQKNPTVWTIASSLRWSRKFQSLNGLELRLALSETAAHVQYVRTSGFHHQIDGLPDTSSAPITFGSGPGVPAYVRPQPSERQQD